MIGLPVASPASVGVDPDAVLAFADAADAAGLELHGLLLARHGRVCARGWWAPYEPSAPHLLYSLSKTFAATAWALAEAEGLVDRERPLVEYWPEAVASAGPRARRWTARHLLPMASGHTADVFFSGGPGDPASNGDGELDLVPWCFAQEPQAEPGALFTYNQLCTYLLAATVQRASGQRLTTFLRSRLFDPLGVDVAAWQADNRGRELGFTGLFARLEAALRLGLLYLGEGEFGGTRLLDAGWFADATAAQVDTSGPEPDGRPRNPDWAFGYGYQVWLGRDGYRGDGAFGQFMIVLPDADAVLASNAGEDDMQAIVDLVWTHLVPGLTGDAAPAPAGEPLDLAGRTHPPEGGPGPGGRFVAAADGYLHEGRGAIPVPVRSLTAEPDADGWRLALDDGSTAYEIVAGDGRWLADAVPGREGTVALASSAGWREGVFRACVRLTSTPHSVVLVGDPATGRLDARWSVPPLRGGRIADLGLPGAG